MSTVITQIDSSHQVDHNYAFTPPKERSFSELHNDFDIVDITDFAHGKIF